MVGHEQHRTFAGHVLEAQCDGEEQLLERSEDSIELGDPGGVEGDVVALRRGAPRAESCGFEPVGQAERGV
ncbi:MAG TPA: hypothetical protein VKM54_20315 [Myxococcota bacterium]|nr:hypothetical protein [Myxococcota bacterium]